MSSDSLRREWRQNWCSGMRHFKFIASVLILAPLFVVAQTASEDLRAQIRTDLKEDPRTSQVSQVEFDALVESIATKAEADGVASDYLESHTTFDYSSLFPEPKKPNLVAVYIGSPLFFASLALLLVLLAVAYYIIRRRGPVDTIDSLIS